MPNSISAQAILFAINSALRLGRNIQRAYANSLKSRALLLPLPSFDSLPNAFTINRFFDTEGAVFVEEIEALKFLHRKNQIETLESEELAEYREYYRIFFFMATEGESNDHILQSGLVTSDLISLLKIRQWEKNAKYASTTLQLVAGTVVEIGIDYFNQFPGALNTESAIGKALSHFLRALDTIPFSEEEDFKKAISKKIIPRLFITVSETLQDLPEHVIRDEKIQLFIEATARGISEDLYQKIGPDMSLSETDEAIQWGQLLLNSLIRNAGQYAFANPSNLLDINKGQEQLIKNTGLTLLDLLYSEEELKLDLKALFNAEALDIFIKNTLAVFAQHPELLAKDDRIRLIVKEISLALANSNMPLQDLLPELLRLILERTALHLPLLWDHDKEAAEHMLVIATQEFLLIFSDPEIGPFKFARKHILQLIEFVLDEVVNNPGWISRKVEDKPLLHHLLLSSFSSIAQLPKEERLQFEMIKILIELNTRLIISHPQVLQKWGLEEEEEKVLLRQILDIILDCLFKDQNETYSAFEKAAQLRLLLSYAFEIILLKHPNHIGLQLIELLLSPEEGLDLSGDASLLEQMGEIFLEFLEEQISRSYEGSEVWHIIRSFIGLLKEREFYNKNKLLAQIKLILEYLRQELHPILIDEEGNPKHLILIAVQQILDLLIQAAEQASPKLKLNQDQLSVLFYLLLNEVLDHQEWLSHQVGEEKVLSELIDVSFETLKQIPDSEKISLDTLIELFEINIFIIASNTKVLDKTKWDSEEKEVVLRKAVSLITDFVFNKNRNTSLNRLQYLLELLKYFLEEIIRKHPNHLGLRVLEFLISEDFRLGLSNGLNRSLLDLYIQTLLEIITTHPEIIAPNPNIQKIITGVAQSLEKSDLNQPDLLPKVLKIILLQTSENIDLEFDDEDGALKNILLEALRQVLDALAFEVEEGKWKPVFRADHIVEIVLYVLEEVSENTDWLDTEDQIYLTLSSIFEAFERIPRHRQPSFSLIKLIVIKLLEAVKNHPGYLEILSETEAGSPKIVLSRVMEKLFDAIYQNISIKATLSVIHQPSIMDALLDYYLYRTSFHPIEEEAILEASQHVAQAVKALDEGRLSNGEELLEQLRDSLV